MALDLVAGWALHAECLQLAGGGRAASRRSHFHTSLSPLKTVDVDLSGEVSGPRPLCEMEGCQLSSDSLAE